MKNKEYFSQFDFRYNSLSIGEHLYTLQVSKLFFEKHENEDIVDSDITINLTLDKKENMVQFTFDIKGLLVCLCDVCLENITIPIVIKESLVLKTEGVQEESGDESIIFFGDKSISYNIEHEIYQYLVSAIPIRKAHGDFLQTEQCNEFMLSKLEELRSKSPIVDPRWEVLKELNIK